MRFILPTSMAVTVLSAAPTLAASGPFFSLKNTDFVVLIAFIAFIGLLIYFKVPGLITGLLDKRAEGIRSELDEARRLHEEARELMASYERKQADVKDQAERIVAQAKIDAERAAEEARTELAASMERRLAAAEGQIASAEAAAVKEVRDRAVELAAAAAGQAISAKMTSEDASKLFDEALQQVESKLH